MRKLILILFIGLVFPVISKAQDQKFHFGFKITPSMAWIKPDQKNLEREGYRLGFTYGVQTEFRLSDNYAFATGAQMSYRGGKLSIDGGTDSLGNNLPNESITFKVQYVEIPLTIKMLTNQFNKVRYFGQFGFAPGMRIRALKEVGSEDKLDAKKDINFFNVNMIIAAGVEYEISGSTVAFGGIEFNNGFVDVIDGDGGKGFSNYLGLNIGILF
ncbi:MAG: PorT family protein [Bacteroidetes bacterium]|nr:PorT family protein [Bacteroidota bacterium]